MLKLHLSAGRIAKLIWINQIVPGRILAHVDMCKWRAVPGIVEDRRMPLAPLETVILLSITPCCG